MHGRLRAIYPAAVCIPIQRSQRQAVCFAFLHFLLTQIGVSGASSAKAVIIAAMSSHAHIALNAQLLSGEESYRSAGIHRYLLNTLINLPKVDPAFSYTVFMGKAAGLPDADRWTVRRSRLPTGSALGRIIWEQALAPLALARVRPDLLHGMAFALPLLWGGPSVVTIFDLSFLRYPARLSASRRLYLRLVTRFSARRARRVLAISQSGKAEIAALLAIPPEKIDVAVPGVESDFCPLPVRQVADFRLRYGLPGRFILYLGTLEPRKNLETLLRAYADLPQRGVVKLLLVGGKGWQTEPIFALIERLGLADEVVIPGFVPRETLPLWYNASEVFVYPSVYEGFGLPLVEAMACGVPVVASNTTSLPEAVGQDGLLLPPNDVGAWTDTLATLLDDASARADLAARGQQRARQFTWEQTARQTVASYRRALDAPG
jgi:glycosyltransferase involved in cell wall biosynthesis